jgi:hypothetical protein
MDQQQLLKIQDAVTEARNILAEYDVFIGSSNVTSAVPTGNSSMTQSILPTPAPANVSAPQATASPPITPPVSATPPAVSLSLPPTKRMAVIHQRRQLASLMSSFASMIEGLPVIGSAMEPLMQALGFDPASTTAPSQADYMLDSTQIAQVQDAIAEVSNSIAAIMATYTASNPAATSTLSPASTGTSTPSNTTSVAASSTITPSSSVASSPAVSPTPPPDAPVPVIIDAMTPFKRRQVAATQNQLMDSELSDIGSFMTNLPIFGPAMAPVVDVLGMGPTPPAYRTFFDNLSAEQLEDIHEAIAQASQAIYTPASAAPTTATNSTSAPTSTSTSFSASVSTLVSTSTSTMSASVSGTESMITPTPSSTTTPF